MDLFGFPYDQCLITLQIIGFILIGYLIYLSVKTKLTHVEEFRTNFIAGLYVLVFNTSFLTMLKYLPIDVGTFLSLAVLSLLIYFISLVLLLKSLLKMFDYIDSLIDIGKEKLKIVMICSLILPSIVYVINLFLGNFVLNISVIATAALLSNIILNFIILLTFYLHSEMKELKIKMMLYFGIGFSVQLGAQLFQVTLNYIPQGIYWNIIQVCYMIMLVFLIVGFSDFKKRMKDIQSNT